MNESFYRGLVVGLLIIIATACWVTAWTLSSW